MTLTAKQKALLFEGFQAYRRAIGDVQQNIQYLFEVVLRPAEDQAAEVARWVDASRLPHADALASFDVTAVENRALLQQKVDDLGKLAADVGKV